MVSELRFDRNAGAWNLTRLGLLIGAHHTPDLDPLIVAWEDAEEAVARDAQRVARLPRPQFGDRRHLELVNKLNEAKGKLLDYIAENPDVLIVQRRLR